MKMTNFLPLVEQFHSLQGEGYHAGKSAFFIRLAGCKVGCSWCDTKNSWDEKKHPSISIEKIIDRIKIARKKGASFCVITGGEPLQHNLDNFCKAIKKMTMGEEQKPMKIHIETSGVNSISGSYDWITLSPKRHSRRVWAARACADWRFSWQMQSLTPSLLVGLPVRPRTHTHAPDQALLLRARGKILRCDVSHGRLRRALGHGRSSQNQGHAHVQGDSRRPSPLISAFAPPHCVSLAGLALGGAFA